MKFNKKRKIPKRKDIVIVLENIERFNIPSKYIKKLNIRKGTISMLKISLDILDNIKDLCSFAPYYSDVEGIKNRFINMKDIVYIDVGKKNYYVPYIENDYVDNILQTNYLEDKVNIVFEWDIDKRNRFSMAEDTLYLSGKYKNEYVNMYDKVVYV